ncbi:hypothetical protein PSCLAVI8L_180132 [Pseudoclavibacter sp. 8L]|nr:hypothetical protein PSCLAVI8L_180132 [Pseudoclavibacter sp. 8L]
MERAPAPQSAHRVPRQLGNMVAPLRERTHPESPTLYQRRSICRASIRAKIAVAGLVKTVEHQRILRALA